MLFVCDDCCLHWWWNHTIMTRSALSSKASVALSCFSFIWDALIRWERKGGERYFAGKGEIIRRRRPTRRKKLYFCMALRVCGKTEHCRCAIKPLSKWPHTIWCERSHHLIRALTPFDVNAHIKWCEITSRRFVKTLCPFLSQITCTHIKRNNWLSIP